MTVWVYFLKERDLVKAAVLHRIGDPLVIEDITLDEPRGQEVLVSVRASGLCHTDLHAMKTDFGFPLPLLLGHEVSGVVERIGPNVRNLKPGDHVVSNLITVCGICDKCQQGQPTLCDAGDALRRDPSDTPRCSVDGQRVKQTGDIGGFAEKILVHERNLVAVNKEIPFPQAALLGCAVITGVGAVKNSAKVRLGDSVAVIGCGGVGLNVVQGALLSGARHVIAIDIHDEKLELARTFGATHTINSRTRTDVLQDVRAITGLGVDHAFEVIGLPHTVRLAVDLTRRGGSTYSLGKMQPDSIVEMSSYDLFVGQKSLEGVLMGSTVAQVDIPTYADLYMQGRLNLDDLIYETIALEEINEGYERLESGLSARSVITFE